MYSGPREGGILSCPAKGQPRSDAAERTSASEQCPFQQGRHLPRGTLRQSSGRQVLRARNFWSFLTEAAPKHTSVALVRRLRPLYADHPDRLRLSIHDGVAHRVVGHPHTSLSLSLLLLGA
jgi:hypothetical protein